MRYFLQWLKLERKLLAYIYNDALTIVVVMWNGLKGAHPWVLAVRVKPVVVIVTCQFGQRPE